MPLNVKGLQKDLESLYDEMSEYEDVKEAKQVYTNKLSTILAKFVKTGTVTVQSGILVTTFGSSGPSTGQTTSPGTGTIS